MNKLLFDKIYFYTVNHNWAKKTAVAVSELSKPFFVLVYILGIIAVFLKGNGGMAVITAVPFFTLLFNTTVRKLLKRPRPFNREDVEQLVEHKNSGSFPSNHACSSVIIALSYMLVCPYAVVPLLTIAFFTGLSRVATGVHYPVDVIAGWSVSLLSGIIFFKIF